MPHHRLSTTESASPVLPPNRIRGLDITRPPISPYASRAGTILIRLVVSGVTRPCGGQPTQCCVVLGERSVPRVLSMSDETLPPVIGPALKRHVALIICAVLLAAGAAAAFAFGQPATYSSSTTVFLRPLAGNALSSQTIKSSQQVTTAMTTEAALVDSVTVLDLVNRQLGTNISTGSGQVTAEVPPNTQTIEVTFTASTPAKAQAGAGAVANALLKTRSSRAISVREAQLRALRSQAEAAAKNLEAAGNAAAQAKPSAASTQQVQLYAAELNDLQTSINRTKAQGSNSGSVIRPAALPSSRSSIDPWLIVAVCGLLGLGLGAALAIWRERTDDRLKASDGPSASGVPILTVAPSQISERRNRDHVDGVVEAFRTARAALLAAAPPPKAISLAASDGYDDAGFVGLNLARSLSRAGYTVTLVCANPEWQVDDSLPVVAGSSLHDLLTSTDAPIPSLPRVGNLGVLAYGDAESSDPDLLAGPRFTQIVRKLKQESDFTLVVANPVAAPGGLAVSLATDCLALTGTKGYTTKSQISRDAGQAQGLGVPVLGVVVVDHGRQGRRRRPSVKYAEDSSHEVAQAPTGDSSRASTAEEFIATGSLTRNDPS